MSIAEKQGTYVEIFRKLSDGDSQCDYLLSLGMNPVGEAVRKPEYRLPGCKTAIWLSVWREDGRVRFQTGSDSLLVNGVLAVFRDLYEEEWVEEVRNNPPVFLKEICDEVIHPDIKGGGLWKWYKQLVRI